MRPFSPFRLLTVFAAACLLVALVSCAAAPTPTPQDPRALLAQATVLIRAAQTFRIGVEQSGAPYNINVDLLGNGIYAPVGFRRAVAQFVAPDVLLAEARLVVPVGGVPTDVGLYAKGSDQWFRLQGVWLNVAFAYNFNPASFIAENAGFQAALDALRDVVLVGSTELEDGAPVIHLKGVTTGGEVTALAVGLIQSMGDVLVDVFIHRDTGYPRRLVLTQPETSTADEPDPTTWTIDVYDVNAPAVLDDAPPPTATPAP